MTSVATGTGYEVVAGDYHRLHQEDSAWALGGFALPDGSFWQYREPNAVVLVRNGWLQVGAVPYTRAQDQIQILDNAKHMYFSRQRFEVPPGGRIVFEISVAARTVGTAKGNLYDGYVSWNLLDFSTGWALDFFTGADTVATVYGRLPFPGVSIPDTGEAKAFCFFHELPELETSQGQEHAYRITYDQAADVVEFEADGRLVDRYENVPDKLTGFTAALGLMSEIDIVDGKSVSCHGQGVIGRWSPMRVVAEAASRVRRRRSSLPSGCAPIACSPAWSSPPGARPSGAARWPNKTRGSASTRRCRFVHAAATSRCPPGLEASRGVGVDRRPRARAAAPTR